MELITQYTSITRFRAHAHEIETIESSSFSVLHRTECKPAFYALSPSRHPMSGSYPPGPQGAIGLLYAHAL